MRPEIWCQNLMCVVVINEPLKNVQTSAWRICSHYERYRRACINNAYTFQVYAFRRSSVECDQLCSQNIWQTNVLSPMKIFSNTLEGFIGVLTKTLQAFTAHKSTLNWIRIFRNFIVNFVPLQQPNRIHLIKQNRQNELSHLKVIVISRKFKM